LSGYHDEARARGPGLVVGRSGASFGKVHYCGVDYWPLNTALFATDFMDNDPRYVYYALKTLDLTKFNSGSAQPSLNRNFIANISVAIPPRAEQVRIASILAALDDKIDSNRRLSQLLEETAATLFKARFVDFVGVEEFDESEIGPVPRGWSVNRWLSLLSSDGNLERMIASMSGLTICHAVLPSWSRGRRRVRLQGKAIALSAETFCSASCVPISERLA
jgi:restriction endonuclease S subunit